MVRVVMSDAVSAIVRGHVLLATCAALYLTWWIVFFRPGASVSGFLYAFGALSLVLAAAAGVSGAVMIGSVLLGAAGSAHVPMALFALGGIIGYVLLAAVTHLVFSRPITTELLLIVAWCTLELACATVLGAGGSISAGAQVALYALTAVLASGSLVAYVLYYNLGALASFIDGAVPLVAVGVEAALVAMLLR